MGPNPVRVTIENNQIIVDTDDDYAFTDPRWLTILENLLSPFEETDLSDEEIIMEATAAAQKAQDLAYERGEFIYITRETEERLRQGNINLVPNPGSLN